MKLLIGTPCRTSEIYVPTAKKIGDLRVVCAKRGIETDWKVIWNEPYVQQARDFLATSALLGDWTHLMFIDSDIDFQPEQVFELAEADVDIIAGPYPLKSVDYGLIQENAGRVPVNMLHHIASPMIPFVAVTPGQPINIKEPLEVKGAATGFMLIKRSVLERYREAFPDRLYASKYPEIRTPLTQFFHVGIQEGTLRGEDLWFCHEIRGIGIKVHLAPWMTLGHIGMYIHEGCYWCSTGQMAHGLVGV